MVRGGGGIKKQQFYVKKCLPKKWVPPGLRSAMGG